MSFNGKVALITGGSSGIGAEAARHLAKLGAKVAIVGRNEKRLNEVAQEITEAHCEKPLQIVADVSKDAERIINETINHFGQLDLLVNNAAIFHADRIENIDFEVFDRMMDVNLRAPMILTKLAVPHLEKTKGNIINISSFLAQKRNIDYVSESITKAGLDQFTKCSAIGLAPKGIRVNSINPSLVRTPIIDKFIPDESERNAFYDKYSKQFLVRRAGDVSDISSAIVYLASQSFINGITLFVDGGAMIAGLKV